ncbi:MAG: metal ABC transporter ATP-binding protein [Elusimicrobiota bacterium]
MNLIRFENARLGYGGRAVLENVSCSVEAGECVGLVGSNGSGKSTFLRTVAGIQPALAGRVEVDRSRPFAYVPQSEELNLAWPLTVRDVVSLPLLSRRAPGRPKDADRRAVEESLERMGVSDIADKLFREISGGQRQRVILAQALSQKPAVLLLDEPTKGLDAAAERDLLRTVRDLRGAGMTILLVAHTLHIPLNETEKIFLFKDGVVLPTTPEELTRPGRLEEIYGVPFLRAEKDGVRFLWPR